MRAQNPPRHRRRDDGSRRSRFRRGSCAPSCKQQQDAFVLSFLADAHSRYSRLAASSIGSLQATRQHDGHLDPGGALRLAA